jgi:transketolase
MVSTVAKSRLLWETEMRRPSDEQVAELEEKAYQIRRLALEMITYGQVGHPGGSLSEADILACLYFSEMRFAPQDPSWLDRDRLILSKAHGCPGQYAALALAGFFAPQECYTYGAINSRLQSHPDMRKTPGVEMSGGALGQGLSVAVGMALGLRHQQRFKPVVYCVVGDGECNSGQIWEAAMAAAHHRCDNLITIVDYNKVQAKGFTWDLMGIEPLTSKWRAFGWEVQECDGHDMRELVETMHTARYVHLRGRPSVIIAHTIKGKGVSWMELNSRWHTHAPPPERSDEALREIALRYGRPEQGYSRLGSGRETMESAAESEIADHPA